MDAIVNFFVGLGDRLTGWFITRVERLTDPESMMAAFIVTVWSVLAGMQGGWLVILIVLAVTWTLHALAVESGNHVVLWLTTSALLIVIVIASQAVFGGLPPVLLAAAGATALAHNELVRINYTRRRNAVVHEEVFHASGLGLAGAALIGVAGIAVTTIASSSGERSWLWMPAAVGVLMLLGYGLAIAPARKASKASKERWQPGERIPPQPLGREDLERF